MREKVESKASLSSEEHVEGSSGNEGKTERLDLEKNKDEGEREIGSAEEVNFEMGENSMGSKEGASGDNVQVSCVCGKCPPLLHMKTACPSL